MPPPVVLLNAASKPTAVLLDAVLLRNESFPTAMLFEAIVENLNAP